ncbi:hypothetical protein B1R27_38245 [Streptomyces sp. GKU 895]|nr:hypothetical protein B1R27_38245 [Streptomyces sp. GKU 895]
MGEQREVGRVQPPGQLPPAGLDAQVVDAVGAGLAVGGEDGARGVQRGQPGEQVCVVEPDAGQLPLVGVGVTLPAVAFPTAVVQVAPLGAGQAAGAQRTAQGGGRPSQRAGQPGPGASGCLVRGDRRGRGHQVLR